MALFLIGGYLLNRLYPLLLNAEPYQLYAGWLLIGLATVLLMMCFGLFISKRTTIMPRNPVAVLIVRGPYRFSRNPMYLSLALYHLGIALATGIWWNLLSFVPAMLCTLYWVVLPEESYMRRHFGEQYNAYCSRVPRWL